MPKHKLADELQAKDSFLMAAGHYRILDTYPTINEEMIRIVFEPVLSNQPPGRYTLILPRETLFSLV